MKYRMFGNTGWMVSEIGVGCWEFSGMSRGGGLGYGYQDDNISITIVERALQLSVNFFDTADAYGLGHSEVVLGRALRYSRQKAIIATKVGNNFYVEPWQKCFDDVYVKNAVENSIQRLGVDCIDLYQLHGPPLEIIENGNIFQTLEELKEKGRIRFYGISIDKPEEGIAAMRMAPGLSSIICPYNILEQEHAKKVFPMAKESGIAIIARSPLATGRLTDTLTEETVFPEGDYRARFGRKWLKDAVKITKKLKFLIKGGTTALAQAALKFILANDAVSVVVPGVKTVAELEENIQASEGSPLPKEDLDTIKDLYEHNFYL